MEERTFPVHMAPDGRFFGTLGGGACPGHGGISLVFMPDVAAPRARPRQQLA